MIGFGHFTAAVAIALGLVSTLISSLALALVLVPAPASGRASHAGGLTPAQATIVSEGVSPGARTSIARMK